MRKNADDLTSEERKAVINDLVGVMLMADEAQKTGLLEERTIAAQLELARLQLTARAMATRYLEQNPVTESELKDVFDENLPRLAGQEFKARHILLETKEEADSVIQQLQQGKSFLDLASERATGPTGPNGGDLGWFTADSMNEPVFQAVSGMKVGAVLNRTREDGIRLSRAAAGRHSIPGTADTRLSAARTHKCCSAEEASGPRAGAG